MPQIGDFPQCICPQNLCPIHTPSGTPLGSNKIPIHLYIIIDVEVDRIENYPSDDQLTVEHIEILPTVYDDLEKAREAALSLIQDYLQKHGDPYDELDDEEFIYFWTNEFGDYVGIKEMNLR